MAHTTTAILSGQRQNHRFLGIGCASNAVSREGRGHQPVLLAWHSCGAQVIARFLPPDLVAAAMARPVAAPHVPRSTPLQLSPERFGAKPHS